MKRAARIGRGFTLTELLVVVAVIALLIAILLPSLRQARIQVKRVACATNLSQLAKAWTMYLDDNRGRFLQGVNQNVNYGGQQGAGSAAYQVAKPLNPYLQLPVVSGKLTAGDNGKLFRETSDADVFRCPADEGSESVSPTYYDYIGSSYITNEMLIGPDRMRLVNGDPTRTVLRKVSRRLPGLNLSDVSADHSRVVLMGDQGWVFTWWFGVRTEIDWHAKRCWHNLAFLDGHVKNTRIRKGLHVTEDYVAIPFRELAYEAADLQVEILCP